jgi:hypothetical protein
VGSPDSRISAPTQFVQNLVPAIAQEVSEVNRMIATPVVAMHRFSINRLSAADIEQLCCGGAIVFNTIGLCKQRREDKVMTSGQKEMTVYHSQLVFSQEKSLFAVYRGRLQGVQKVDL